MHALSQEYIISADLLHSSLSHYAFSQVPGPPHLSLELDLHLVVSFLSLVLMIIELFSMEDMMVNVVAELVTFT